MVRHLFVAISVTLSERYHMKILLSKYLFYGKLALDLDKNRHHKMQCDVDVLHIWSWMNL